MSNLDIALRYAAAGFKIFPLHTVIDGKCTCGQAKCNAPDSTSQGKHPRNENGSHGATTIPRIIKEWFAGWPDSNIGMTLDGLVVVDVDPRNRGDETFDDLISKRGALPHTWTQRTGSGGSHYVFRARPNAKYRKTLGAGIDLKYGFGQYIVVEPSLHKQGSYVWLDEEGPIYGGEIADAPEWLWKVEEEEKKHFKADSAGRFHSGGRNNALYERARRLRDLGLSQREMYGALAVMNEERCNPPLPIAEVATICKSAAQNEPEHLRRNIGGFIKILDFMKTFVPPVWLVNGIMQQGFVYSLTALTNHGKTAIATTLALSIATGRVFGALRVTQGRVLYLCGENPQDFNSRLHGSIQEIGIADAEVAENFVVYPIADKLSNLCGEIKNFCEEIGGVSLIVVDTSVAYFSYEDENDNVAARQHGQDLRSLAGGMGGPAVLTLSHPIKNAEQNNLTPRGGSGFMNEIDCNLTAYLISDNVIEFWHTKIRGPGFAAFPISLKELVLPDVVDSYGQEVRSVVAIPISGKQAEKAYLDDLDDTKQLVMAMHYNQDGTLISWATALGWSEKKVRKHIGLLTADGYAHKVLRQLKLTEKGMKLAQNLLKKTTKI